MQAEDIPPSIEQPTTKREMDTVDQQVYFTFNFASPKCEMDTHAEIALQIGADNIFKAIKLVVSKKLMKYIPGSVNCQNQLS